MQQETCFQESLFGKTSPEPSKAIKEKTSQQSLTPWQTSGRWIKNGMCWTHAGSESPKKTPNFPCLYLQTAISQRSEQQIFPVGKRTSRNNQPPENTVGFYSTQGKYDVPEIGWMPPLKTVAAPCIAGTSLQPRKLTPVEAERLMGWPDNHTLNKADGTQQADSHRYKQCGNGVATPVARWVAHHLKELL